MCQSTKETAKTRRHHQLGRYRVVADYRIVTKAQQVQVGTHKYKLESCVCRVVGSETWG